MHMVFISADLNERYLVAFADFQTCFFEFLVNFFCKDYSPVFGRADDVVQQQRDIVTLMDILAHSASISQQAAGNMTRRDSTGARVSMIFIENLNGFGGVCAPG